MWRRWGHSFEQYWNNIAGSQPKQVVCAGGDFGRTPFITPCLHAVIVTIRTVGGGWSSLLLSNVSDSVIQVRTEKGR